MLQLLHSCSCSHFECVCKLQILQGVNTHIYLYTALMHCAVLLFASTSISVTWQMHHHSNAKHLSLLYRCDFGFCRPSGRWTTTSAVTSAAVHAPTHTHSSSSSSSGHCARCTATAAATATLLLTHSPQQQAATSCSTLAAAAAAAAEAGGAV
jgi:hypothetical protein